MSNPVTPTVEETLLLTDTSANALVVGAAIGGTSGTGGIKAGPIVSSSSITDSVGSMATIRAGGIGIASQAALDFIFASSGTQLSRIAKGSALQYVRMNSGATGYEFASAPPIALIGEAEGTDATAAATNVATFAISGLTVKDHLHVVLRHSSATQATNAPVLYNSTDSVTIHTVLVSGGTVGADTAASGTVDIYPDQSSTTLVVSTGMVAQGHSFTGNDITGTVRSTSSVFTTAWTGSWTLALRTGAGGVVAGGTYRYRIAVFKVSGQ